MATLTLDQKMDKLIDAVSKQPVRPVPSSAPAAREGENVLSSRPLSISKLASYMTGQIDAKDCKHETDAFGWFTKAMKDSGGGEYSHNSGVLVPLDWDKLPDSVRYASEADVIRKSMAAGEGFDPDEMRALIRKSSNPMSYIDQAYGGAFIPPPQFGEPIDLLRNKSVCFQAGATQVTLPPQGSIVYPRQTSASDAYWEGENTDAGTESKLGTGDVALQAKQLKCFVRVPNQWLRFAPGAADALVKNDMTTSVQLKIDKAALEGPGGPGIPLGLMNSILSTTKPNGITAYTGALGGAGTANDPYVVRPEDGDLMISKIEEANAEFGGWVMSPKMWRACIKQLRADAVTAGDNKGRFMFDSNRSTAQGLPEQWIDYKVNRSNQVSTSRTRGTATGLSYILGGYWPDLLIGMHGAIELLANDRGDEAFKKNQTLLRAIAFADVGIRRGASFVAYDAVKLALS